MPHASILCPGCGSRVSGKFCQECGTAVGGEVCAGCSQPLTGQGRFCAHCGATRTSAGQPGGKAPWVISGVAGLGLLVLLVFVLARSEPVVKPAVATPQFAADAAGTPPDISSLTPRERFDRLYNRVMSAAESGDMATVTQFTPMAVMAYDQLGRVDADARFHLALLRIHTGDAVAVEALADTILQQTPGHLFAYMIRGARARFAGDSLALKQAYADFLGHYEEEMARGRPEYGEHKRSVEDFLTAARGA